MAGTVSVSADRRWSVSSGLFYWVINDIARHTSDVELARHLAEIDRENLGWFGLDDITPDQRREVHRVIAERLLSDGEREFTADLVARQSALGLLKDLVTMASGAPEPVIVDILREEFEAWRQTLPVSAVAKFEEFPRPAGAGRAVRVAVEALPCMAEATVWERVKPIW